MDTTPDDDGAPVWAPDPGTALVPGLLAWHRLGVGHRCETWLVWDVDRWAPVVLKLARPHQVDHPRAQQALAREGVGLGAHPHPHLPRLYADRHDAAHPHLVIEYLDGPALDELVDEHGPFGEAETVALAAQLTGVLRWLHRHDVAHLDLKPANVVVRDGEPMLVDLGAARVLAGAGGSTTGSPGYAAPELEVGAAVSAATDLYGLGTVLCEVLTGEPAFDPELAAAHRPDPATLPLSDGPLADLVRALLAPDPAARPADADAVLRALHALGPAETIWPEFAPDLLGAPRRGADRVVPAGR